MCGSILKSIAEHCKSSHLQSGGRWGGHNLRHHSHMLLTRCIRCAGAHRDSLLIHFFTPQMSHSQRRKKKTNVLARFIKTLSHSPACLSFFYFYFWFAHLEPADTDSNRLSLLCLFLCRIRTIRQLQPTGGHRHQATAQW